MRKRSPTDLMRLRIVGRMTVVFGQVRWGGPSLVMPLLEGSVIYADRIMCRREDVGPDAVVSSPCYVVDADRSVTIFEVVGGGTVAATTMRDPAALAAWEAWVGGVGTTEARR